MAALTLPAIIQNYQKMVIKNQFKKSYSTLMNALRMTEVAFGTQPMCYYGDDNVGRPCLEWENGNCIKYGDALNPTNRTEECSVFKSELKKALKVIKVCESNALANGCIPPYKGKDTMYLEMNPDATEEDMNSFSNGVQSWRESNIHTKCESWVLADGTIILWYDKGPRLFGIDVNGMKKPNKWGYDIFAFEITSHLGKSLWLSAYAMIEKGGVDAGAMLRDSYK